MTGQKLDDKMDALLKQVEWEVIEEATKWVCSIRYAGWADTYIVCHEEGCTDDRLVNPSSSTCQCVARWRNHSCLRHGFKQQLCHEWERSMKPIATTLCYIHHCWVLVTRNWKKFLCLVFPEGYGFHLLIYPCSFFILVALHWCNSPQFIPSIVLSSVISVEEYDSHPPNALHCTTKHMIDEVQLPSTAFASSRFLALCRGLHGYYDSRSSQLYFPEHFSCVRNQCRVVG